MTEESRTEMGISTELWRARIGCFVQPQKCKVHLRGIKLGSLSLSIRILLFTLLAVHCVETNPGPPKPSRGGSSSSPGGASFGAGRGREPPRDRESQRWLRSSEMLPSRTTHSTNASGMQGSQPPINSWFGSPSQSSNQTMPMLQQGQSHFLGANNGGEISMTELKNIMLNVQTSIRNIDNKFEDMEKSMREVKESNEKLIKSNNEINEAVGNLSERVSQLEKDLKQSELKREKLEAQSRRENLRFYGIEQDRDETWQESEGKIKDYIAKDLEMNVSEITIERAHRMKSGQKPYPIIAKFAFFKEKEAVLKAYRRKRKESNEKRDRAQNKNENADGSQEGEDDEENVEDETFRKEITVCEDFPSRVMKARNDLRGFLRNALKDKKEAYLKYDKLIIDGETFEYDETSEDIVQVQTER